MHGRARSTEAKLLASLSRSKSLVVSDQNLNGINLGRRALLGIEFQRCELAGANFRGADLSLARFIDCNLYSADFSESVLYTTWFYECNLTKANFRNAYLLGFRLRNVDITKAEFDDVPAVGLERKVRESLSSEVLRSPLLGVLPARATELDQNHSGITMARFERIVAFIKQTEDSEPRAKIRAAETAKYLRSVHADNGYETKAAHYYIVERRLRRQAMGGSLRSKVRRAQDLIFGEIVWRYGTSLIRPIVAFAILAMISTAISYFAPQITPGTGLRPAVSSTPYSFNGWNVKSLLSFLNVGYFYLTAPAGGSGAQLVGWVKAVFVAYVFLALWLIALTFDAFTRKVATSR
jgi:Pentapeptide repeats (9 copies)